jgi:translocation and assembly module TamB
MNPAPPASTDTPEAASDAPVGPTSASASASAPTPATAPRKRRLRVLRWSVRLLWLAVIALPLAAALGLGLALRSEAGSAWLLTRLPALPGLGHLTVTAPRGALLGPDFSADRVRLSLPGMALELDIDGLQWQGAQWRWWLGSDIWAGVEATRLQAQAVRLRWRPDPATPLRPPPTLRLPLQIRVSDFDVATLQVQGVTISHIGGGGLQLGADGGASHRVERVALMWDRLQAQGRLQIAADAPYALQGRVDAQGTAEPAWSAALQAEGTLQAPLVQGTVVASGAPGSAPPALDLRAELRPYSAWPLGPMDLRLQSLDLAPLASGLPRTRLTGRARVETNGPQAPVIAQLDLQNTEAGTWDKGRLPLERARGALSVAPTGQGPLDLRELELQFSDGAKRAGIARGSGRWDQEGLRLALSLEGVRPALIDTRGPRMTLSGPARLHLPATPLPGMGPAPAAPLSGAGPAVGPGTPPSAAGRDLEIEVQATLDGLLETLNRPLSLEFDAGIGTGRLTLRKLQAASGPARAALQGEALREPGGPWHLRSEGRLNDFDPAPWLSGAADAWRRGAHRLSAAWTLDIALPRDAATKPPLQVLQSLQGSGRISLAPSVLAGVSVQGQAEIGQTPGPAGAVRSQLRGELTAGGNRLSVEGQAEPSGNGATDRWRLAWSAPSLANLAPLAILDPALARWLPTAGQTQGTLNAQGRWPALRTDGELRLQCLRAGAWAVGEGQARWKIDPAGRDAMQVRLDLGDAVHYTTRIARLVVDGEGSLQEHRVQVDLSAPLQPPPLLADALGWTRGAGTQARLVLRGSWAAAATGAGRWSGKVLELRAGAWNGSTPPTPTDWLQARDLAAELDWSTDGRLVAARLMPGQATVGQDLRLRWKEARYRANAGRDDAELEADIDPFAVAPILQRLGTGLSWSGDLRAQAKLRVRAAEEMEAELRLQRIDGDLAVTDGDTRFPLGVSALDVALLAEDGRWTLSPLFAGRTLGTVSGAVTLANGADSRWPDLRSALNGAVLFRVPNLGIWSAWIPAGWRVDGAVETVARLGGRLGAPEVVGELRGEGIAVRNLLQGVDYAGGELSVVLQGSTARIDRLSLRGGEGTLVASGSAQLGASPQARLDLQADGFRVLGRIDRQLVASGRAVLELRPDRVQLEGKVSVDSGLFDLATRDAPTLDEDVTVRRRSEESPQTRLEPPPPSPLMRQAAVRLDVDLGQRLRVRGRGLDTLLKGDLRVSTPQGRLAVDGAVRTEGGTYVAYGQRLKIERGILAFTGRVDTPRLDILALRPNIDMPVGVAISGTPQAVRVRLVSEPELPESEKLSWLVLGRGSEGLVRADAAVLQRAAVALLAGEREAPTDALLRTFGIDELSLRQGDGEVRTTVVTLGKQLSRNWYLGYERSVNATAGTWQLVYRIAQQFTLRAQSGQENSLDLIFTWRFDRATPPGRGLATPPPPANAPPRGGP